MFERFTNAARRVVVLAQEEAREIGHNYIGTEHLVLGLIHEDRGIAGQVLRGLGMTLEEARQDAVARVGKGQSKISKRIPFTPRAKKTLEGALREALQLSHNYIGTEHLLLGVIREGEGAGAQMLDAAGGLERVRAAVLEAVSKPGAADEPGDRRATIRVWSGGSGVPEETRTTPAADSGLDEAARLAGTGPVGSHHLVLAALTDPGTAATRALSALGIDLDQVRAALREADVTDSTDELPEEAGRRQMLIRPAAGKVTIELADPVITGLAAEAAAALSEDGTPAEVITGDLAAASSLSKAWLALRDSLEDIRRNAGASGGAADDGGDGGGDGQAAGTADPPGRIVEG
jgi:hypothetical protein